MTTEPSTALPTLSSAADDRTMLTAFLGQPYDAVGEPWSSRRGTDPDWEWDVRADSGPRLLAWFDEACEAARQAYATADSCATLSRIAGSPDPGEEPGEDETPHELRWILTHLIEEHARHAGHLDLLREHLDGTTGD
ncbi:DUF664 domain-containing protein [Arsenicicoccus dermatophilus]|uniref:mycothiol transferase n=1 Tax=Arsenicicoccus dermatophilus TaxID=1076331 RepID=UPI001F4C64AB|nr:DinB family protein [Arsenicicoccus dermatophilus]